MLKLSDNPPCRYPQAGSLREYQGTWWVGHTRSRFEKAFAWRLLKSGIPYYLPMVEKTRLSGGRKRTVLSPLFSSYVFFCGDAAQRYEAMTTNCLCQTLPVEDRDTLVEQILAIETALASKTPLDPYGRKAVGRRCRVRAGALAGYEGVVVREQGRARIVLEVSILGQGAALEIETDLLDPID